MRGQQASLDKAGRFGGGKKDKRDRDKLIMDDHLSSQVSLALMIPCINKGEGVAER